MTLAEWSEVWLPTKLDLRASSRSRLEGVVRTHIVPMFGHQSLAEVTNSQVRSWIATMSPATARKAYAAPSQMMSAAVADRRLAASPCVNVPFPPVETHEQRFLSKDEVNLLADCVDKRFRCLILLAAYGGLRFGELAGLRRKRVDVLRCRVTVTETLVEVAGELIPEEPKTKRSRRVIPLPRSIMRELEAHLGRYVAPDADAYVFTAARGERLRRSNFRRRHWQRATAVAGLEGLRFHDLRHTFVALWVDAGANPKEVSVRAGHTSVAFTLDRYGHLYQDRTDDIADQLDALLRVDGSHSK
jgi:integrase